MQVQTRVMKLSLLANTLEWYELSLLAYLTPLMGALFIQTEGRNLSAWAQAYILLAIGYLARPLGSLFWGYLGDTRGRAHSLQNSLLSMAIPTALIGLLPTYHQAGPIATCLLLLLRLIHGFSLGGERPMNACYIFENTPPKQHGFYGSLLATSDIIGFLGGSAVTTLLFWQFTHQTLLDWAWRLPYLLSIPISISIGYIRNALREPTSRSSVSHPKNQTRYLNSQFIWAATPCLILCGFIETCGWLLFIWLPSYLQNVFHIAASEAQWYNTIGLCLWGLFNLLSGTMVDRYGYKRVVCFHIIAIIVSIYPLFYSMQTATPSTFLLIYGLLSWLLSGMSTTLMPMLGNRFPRATRGLGMSITFTLATTLFGSTAPIICSLFSTYTSLTLFSAFYVIGLGLCTLPIALRLHQDKTTAY